MNATGLLSFLRPGTDHYIRLMRLQPFLAEPLSVIAAGYPDGTERIVLDASHEGYACSRDWLAATDRLKAETGAGIVFAQTNPQFAIDAAGSGHTFSSFHHHAWRLLEQVKRHGHAEAGRANLDRTPERAVLCMNNTPRIHRVLALKTLRDNLPAGSFRGTLVMLASPKISNATQTIEREAAAWKLDVPLDALLDDILGWADTGTDRNMVNLVDSIDTHLYADTFFSLVTETEMRRPDMRRYTEKSLKPLVMGHPVVILGNMSVVRQLEELGFDLLRDEIDHSYDDEPHPIRRFEMVMQSALGLARMPLADRKEFLARNRARLAGNIAVLEGELMDRYTARWSAELR